MTHCLFCKIIKKELPATILHEDEQVLVFQDVYPQAPEHVLLIPRRHIATFNDLEETDGPLLAHLLLLCKKMARDLGMHERGYRLVSNCNADAGQTVFHLHFHLLAGRKLGWPPG